LPVFASRLRIRLAIPSSGEFAFAIADSKD
jgi:hypothetical protein